MSANFSFRKAAERAISLSFLTMNREKADIEDIVNRPVTIIGYDFANSRDKDTNQLVVLESGEIQQYAIFIIAEDNDHYYNAGTVISNAFLQIHSGYGGTTEEACADLQAEGGLAVTIVKKKSRGGNSYWSLILR